MTQRIYSYGCQQPDDATAAVIDHQIVLGDEYYNRLVRSERIKRYAVIVAQRRIPELAALMDEEDVLEEYLAELKRQRKEAKSRDRRVAMPPASAGREEIARLRVIRARMRELKTEHNAVLHARYEQLDQEWQVRWGEEYKRARRRGLHWGTCAKIIDAFKLARAATLTVSQVRKIEKEVEERAPNTPRKRRRWQDMPAWRPEHTGRGLIATQAQKGITPEEAFSCEDTRIQIDPIDPRAFDVSYPRGERNRMCYTTVRIRVGSNHDRSPIWATLPAYIHRPLPPNCKIKWAVVVRRPWDRAVHPKQAMKYKWKLQFTVDIPDVRWDDTTKTARPGSIVALNRGWRQMEDGSLRVATWADDAGNTGELRLPLDQFRDRLLKANSIQSYRDEHRNELQTWLLERGVDCARWRAGQRYLKLLHDIEAEQHSPQDEEIACHIREWADRDEHLRRYQRGLREGALRFRKKQYESLSLELANAYPTIVTDTYDIRNLAENETRQKGPSYQRVQGAPSILLTVIKGTGERLGCLVSDGKVKLATQMCHLCGHGEERGEHWNAAPQVMHTCRGCGATWDQDVNHALNLLSRAQQQIAEEGLDSLRKPKRPPRFAGRHLRRTEEPVAA
jgi:hypothetical protein